MFRKIGLYVLLMCVILFSVRVYAQDTVQAPFQEDINTALHKTLVEMLIPTDAIYVYLGLSPETIQKDFGNPDYKPNYSSAPGAVLYVQSPEGLFFESEGISNVVTREPLERTAHYEIGSTTKTMTAAIILQLQEEGKLSIDDLIGKHVPELAAIIPFGDTITLRHLLTHTSGMPEYLNGGLEKAISTDIKALEKAYAPEELVKLAVEQSEPTGKPGDAWNYCNTGYILLGLIIEKITGQSVADVYKARIFGPLGMKDTYFPQGVPQDDRMPSGYLSAPYEYETTTWNTSQGWTAGAVISTVPDMAIYIRALVRGELFKKAETVEAMQAFGGVGRTVVDVFYGLGLENYQPGGIWGHAGETLGFQSNAVYIPDRDMTIIVWGNSAQNIADFIPSIVSKIVGYTGLKAE